MTRTNWTVATALLAAMPLAAAAQDAPQQRKITQGTLSALGKEGKPLGDCPLKHTDVKVTISAHLAYVTVTQQFANPFAEKIEAVYTFPLGADAAVGEMLMRVGDRIIEGQIKPREEARQIYEAAKAAGHVASLLDQERPNIFTQSVANIEPGKEIDITIGYTETLKYRDGVYQFVFPMVVGPRFIPGPPPVSPGGPPPQPVPLPAGAAKPNARGLRPAGPVPEGTPAVPDADRITPPVTPEGTRAGHDISISGMIDAGMPVKDAHARLHDVKIDFKNADHTRVAFELAKKKELPNKDFVLEFTTAADDIAEGVITCADKRGGHFMLVLQPPKKVTPAQIRPREIIFVIDTSGSQQGFPLETSRAIMDKVVQELRKDDTFNILQFANTTKQLFDKPVANTKANRDAALAFIRGLKAAGGTQLDKAITAALEGKPDGERLRLVIFFTDGLIGHDFQVLDIVRKNAAASRVFVYGTGNSANRFLLDNMARLGRGEVEYAMSPKEAEKAVSAFYNRIDAPVLTDISIDWGDLKDVVIADEVYPKALGDLFSVQPIVVKGRYKPGQRTETAGITITGRTATGNYRRRVGVTLPPAGAGGNMAIPQQWARAKIDELMSENYIGAQTGKADPNIKDKIVALAMDYRLMTQYTSFVAVEMKEVTIGGEVRRVEVPVEMPEGMSYEGVFGEGGQGQGRRNFAMAKGGPGGGWGGGGMLGGAMPALARAAVPGAMRRPMAPAPSPTGAAAPGKPMSPVAGPFTAAEKRKEAAADAPDGRHYRYGAQAIKEDTKLSDAEKKTKIAEMKLAKCLQGLAARLDKNGNFSEGKVVVKDGKITLAVYLNKLDDAALEELKKLGFVKLLDAPAVQMVIGTIEVKKLQDLAYLDCVRRIDLPTFAK